MNSPEKLFTHDDADRLKTRDFGLKTQDATAAALAEIRAINARPASHGGAAAPSPCQAESINAQIRAALQARKITQHQAMIILTRTFPCLEHFSFPGERFNPELLINWSRRVSTGESAVAAFLLTVWNSYQDRVEFKLGDVWKWDPAHKAAFIDWFLHPWWC